LKVKKRLFGIGIFSGLFAERGGIELGVLKAMNLKARLLA